MGEKTEKATPKKLQDARKKGQIAKSQDVPAAATFAVSIAMSMAMAPTIYDNLTEYARLLMQKIPTINMTSDGASLMMQAIWVIMVSSLPIVAAVAMVGALANFFMVGPMFSTEVFKFNLKKFDPIQNLKQKFKMKTLMELLKSLLKITIAAFLCYRICMNGMDLVISAMGQPIIVCLHIVHYFLHAVLVQITLLFLIIAAFDWFYQKQTFDKEMMMEKFEIKQEFKNSEGDPEIKGKRKEVAREIAYGGGNSPKGAKALVTNPTHLAIAIGYEAEYPAPYIIAKASGGDAGWLIREAEKLDIPVLRNVYLARQLYEACEPYTYVPVDTYEAIAEILRWVATLKPLENQEEFHERDSR